MLGPFAACQTKVLEALTPQARSRGLPLLTKSLHGALGCLQVWRE